MARNKSSGSKYCGTDLPAIYAPPLANPLQSNAESRECERQVRKKKIKKVVAIASTVVVVPVVILYFIVTSATDPSIHVESASLKRFSLSNDGRVISYNLTADISVRNSNRLHAARYKEIECDVLYGGELIASWKRLPPNLYQERKTTTMLRVEFAGETAVADPGSEVWKLFQAQGIVWGAFDVQIAMRASVGHDFARMRGSPVPMQISCLLHGLRIEANATAKAASLAPSMILRPPPFSRTKCSVEDFDRPT